MCVHGLDVALLNRTLTQGHGESFCPQDGHHINVVFPTLLQCGFSGDPPPAYAVQALHVHSVLSL